MDPTYPEQLRARLRHLLADYSFEEILELGKVEEVDALEYLILTGTLDLNEIIEATDDRK